MKMALSSLNKIVEEHKSALFYNKYEYRISFDLHGAWRTNYCDNISQFDEKINDLTTTYSGYNFVPRLEEELKKIDRTLIAKFIYWRGLNYQRGSKQNSMTISTQSDSVKIYTNDVAIINEIKQLGFDNVVTTKVTISIPHGVMLFANPPPSNYRTYFKYKRVDEDFRSNLRDFLTQNTNLQQSSALRRWLGITGPRWSKQWLSQTYFVDYENESMKTMLVLMFGNTYIGKHYELKQR